MRVFESGMSWFSWIAGLSFVNTLLVLIHAGWSFMFGLTATQFLDYNWYNYFSELSFVDNVLLAILYLLIIGSVALSGYLSKRRYIWAMWLGLILVILDGFLSLYIQDYWGAAFHAFVVFRVFNGYLALHRAGKEKNISIKNPLGKQKLKFSAYLILNILIIFFFWAIFLLPSDV